METNANHKVTCVANYAYDAVEADELSLRPGDVLHDVERLPGGWWRGELRGRRGMFPDNFVSVLTDQVTTRPGGVQGRCRAVFSYQPANPDELPLCVGDVLDVLGEVEEGWWQGRRMGRVGVFPSNFVVLLDPAPGPAPASVPDPAPKLPPKPVKEQCRVLFPYTAVNEDELTLCEGDIVTIVSKDAPDRGWWRGELRGKVGLFPDNFVQIIPSTEQRCVRLVAPSARAVHQFKAADALRLRYLNSEITQDVEEKKPERPSKTSNTAIYPILNKYSEKTASVKELTTSKISLHKENIVNKESTIQSTVTHTNKSESEKLIHNETVTDGTGDGQVKKPPVPLKKSPTPATGVGGLFSGLKSKMLNATEKEKEKDKDKEKEKEKEKDKEREKDKDKSSTSVSSGGSSGGEWDRADGAAVAKPIVTTFDHVERNSILNDPRAGRVKAPRRRPPSQILRDDSLTHIGLSNGHEANEKPHSDKEKEKAEEIKPRAREWEKHKAPWMEELKLNQAKKTSFGETKLRSVSASSDSGSMAASKTGGGSTDRILDCGLEEKRSTHSMEMSKSTSSISGRISVIENIEESVKTRHSLESKKDTAPPLPASEPPPKPNVQSPTAAGRTFTTMLEEIKKTPAPSPPSASARYFADSADKSPHRMERTVVTSEKQTEVTKMSSSGVIDKTTMAEKSEDRSERLGGTLDRKLGRADRTDSAELIAQLNSRITNLEKLLEVQNAKFNAAIEELNRKLAQEAEQRAELQQELHKLANCVTQV